MMIDNSSIFDADLLITITYITDEGNDISQIFETTDSNGIATFSQIVPYNYAGDLIDINVTYDGNSTVKGVSENITKTVQGMAKIPFGGAKSGIVADPKQMSEEKKNGNCKSFFPSIETGLPEFVCSCARP